MRRVRSLVAVCAAFGLLLPVSGATPMAAGAEAVGESAQAEPVVAESPTFTRDVLPILQRSCQRCHRPGTGALPAGGLFRFAPHYHPWGEETIDRQKVGVKFYPEGEVPELIVTAHRIRTGIGHDWKLNREAVEDRLLRAGYDLDRLPLQGAAPVPERHHPAHRLMARQHRQQPSQSGPVGVDRLGRPHHGRDGPRLDRRRFHDRRAVRPADRRAGGAGERRVGGPVDPAQARTAG